MEWPDCTSRLPVGSFIRTCLGTFLGFSGDVVERLVTSYPSARIIYTVMTLTEQWPSDPHVLREFAEYWRSLPNLTAPLVVVVCVMSDAVDVDDSILAKLSDVVKFDDQLWGCVLQKLEKLKPKLFETIERDPQIYTEIRNSKTDFPKLKSAFLALSQLGEDIHMEFVEETLDMAYRSVGS